MKRSRTCVLRIMRCLSLYPGFYGEIRIVSDSDTGREFSREYYIVEEDK